MHQVWQARLPLSASLTARSHVRHSTGCGMHASFARCAFCNHTYKCRTRLATTEPSRASWQFLYFCLSWLKLTSHYSRALQLPNHRLRAVHSSRLTVHSAMPATVKAQLCQHGMLAATSDVTCACSCPLTCHCCCHRCLLPVVGVEPNWAHPQ
jgi:hypothetical protein